MKKQKGYVVSDRFQMAFIASLTLVFLIQSGWLFYTWIDQYNQNPYVGGFELWAASTVIFPIVVFTLAFFLRPRRALPLNRVFDAFMVSAVALSAYTLVNLISNEIYLRNITPGSGYDLSAAYEYYGMGVFLLFYFIALLYFKKNQA